MESIDAEELDQSTKIVGSRAGRRTRLRHGTAPPAAIVRYNTEPSCGEHGKLVFPVLSAARIRVQENNGYSVAARVLVPKPHSGKFRVCFARLRKRQGCKETQVN